MGASPLMAVGLRAMTASYAAMQATSHNIANANVAGYSRQQAELATSKGQYSGIGFIGKGVDVQTIARVHDDFVTRAAATARGQASMDATRLNRLQQLEDVLPPGETGLGHTVSGFLNAMVDLASRPADAATRQVVLARAQDMATRFNTAANQIDVIQAGVTQDLKTSVTTINGLAASVAKLNDQIAAANGLGQPPNDLLDERDHLVSEMAALVQVSTITAQDGTMGVFIGGGQRLVLGSAASSLAVTLDPDDPSRSALTLVEAGTSRMMDEKALGGGSVAGLLRFQNDDLVDGRNLVGQLAASVAGAVNAQQLLGVNQHAPAGSVPSQPMFSVGAPLAIPSVHNQRGPGGGYAASVSLTVVDATVLQPANYALRPDPAGSGLYQLTRQSEPPMERLIASGDVVDGMRIDIGSPPPAAGDRFQLQPVSHAAQGLVRLLQDPRDLAAASPLVASLGNANTGTAGIAALTMTTVPPEPAATTRITFTSNGGDYDWELLDSGGSALASGSGHWAADSAIDGINGYALQLSGVPKAGDTIDVQPTPTAYLASNNGNALALAALRDAVITGRTQAADGSIAGGSTATDAYAAAMADVGVRVQTAKSTSTISQAVSSQAELQRSDISGVNLDEEAARLIQFQQSYQAAAKVLQIAQAIFQTLLDTAGG